MSVNEFVFDLEAFDEEMNTDVGSKGLSQRGWNKESGRYCCLVPDCKKRALSFGHKFALSRHWMELHSKYITLYKCSVVPSCRTFKRPYDLERHLCKMHHMSPSDAKIASSGGALKTTQVENQAYISPGEMEGPKSRSVAGTGKPISESVPCQTVMDIDPKHIKVQFDTSPEEEGEASEVNVDTLLSVVPEPHIQYVKGARLSASEEREKQNLLQEIWLARDKIQEWTKREKTAKEQLKRLECKEQHLREQALKDELRGERSERRRMEEEMRRLKGQIDKRHSVLDSVDSYSYQELGFGDSLNFEE